MDKEKITTVIEKTGQAYMSDEGKYNQDCLIPMLQALQQVLGFLPQEAVEALNRATGIPVSRIYGVISFYEQFKLEPDGKYKITVCRGTACHVHGGEKIIDTIREILDIDEGGKTADNLFSFDTVPCLGACALAPVVVINKTYHGKMNTQKTRKRIEQIRSGENRSDD
ncbi:MAG: NAD(P)H-dependent oxidoreductase subunit E [Spirochaetales bacterium]|nr:NAD(P)H-dependent oxidoreductase subunit E [Spirochaetales bacterium]